MTISVLFDSVGLSYLFGFFMFIASIITTLYIKGGAKKKEREAREQRVINEAILQSFKENKSSNYFDYYYSQKQAERENSETLDN